MFYSQRGKYKLAFILKKEIHDKAVTEKGEEHPDTLIAMGNLASTYSDLGEAREAKKLEIEVLELSKRILSRRASRYLCRSRQPLFSSIKSDTLAHDRNIEIF
jgi:hypothetical protein